MSFKFNSRGTDSAELDVTSFMNLMIVLVPVLLLSMTFTQVTVLEIKLPELTGGATSSEESQPNLEVVVNENGFKIFYPTNVLLQEIPLIDSESKDYSLNKRAKKNAQAEITEQEKAQVEEIKIYNFVQLSRVLQEVKKQLSDKRDVLILSEPDIDYQNLVATMDAVKSYKTVVAASVVEIELFPEISLGDAL